MICQSVGRPTKNRPVVSDAPGRGKLQQVVMVQALASGEFLLSKKVLSSEISLSQSRP